MILTKKLRSKILAIIKKGYVIYNNYDLLFIILIIRLLELENFF